MEQGGGGQDLCDLHGVCYKGTSVVWTQSWTDLDFDPSAPICLGRIVAF